MEMTTSSSAIKSSISKSTLSSTVIAAPRPPAPAALPARPPPLPARAARPRRPPLVGVRRPDLKQLLLDDPVHLRVVRQHALQVFDLLAQLPVLLLDLLALQRCEKI